MLMFGGLGDQGLLGDTWEFSFSKKWWRLVEKPAWKKNPAPRHHSSMVSYMGCAYLFGGDCSEQLGLTNDLWCYSCSSWSRVYVTNAPSPVSHHVAVVHNDSMIVFGGLTAAGSASNQIHRYDFKLQSWSTLEASHTPPAHAFCTSVLLGSKLFTLFASRTSTTQPQLFSLCLDNLVWEEKPPLPSAGLLRGTAAISIGSSLIFYGGKLKSGISNEVWIFHAESDTWRIPLSQGLIPQLYFHSMIEWKSRAWIFGGMGPTGNVSMLCTLSGSRGEETSTSISTITEGSGEESGQFSVIPDDVVVFIFSFLPSRTLAKMCEVSRRMRRLASRNSLWKPLLSQFLENQTIVHIYEVQAQHSTSNKFWKDILYNLMAQDSYLINIPEARKGEILKNVDGKEVRVILMGKEGVGKSSLTVLRFCGRFPEEFDPTIEDSYRTTQRYYGSTFIWEVLDTATDFTQLNDHVWAERYMLGVHAAVIMYAINDRKSFNQVPTLVEKIRVVRTLGAQYSLSWPAVILCATKCDMEPDRQVPYGEGASLALSYGFPFLEISPRARHNIEVFWEMLALEAAKRFVESPEPPQSKCMLM
ncbi:GTPase KRas [Pelomyxa schiedti]|nr:GTPase KRas [Pelomyxa schiedti]